MSQFFKEPKTPEIKQYKKLFRVLISSLLVMFIPNSKANFNQTVLPAKAQTLLQTHPPICGSMEHERRKLKVEKQTSIIEEELKLETQQKIKQVELYVEQLNRRGLEIMRRNPDYENDPEWRDINQKIEEINKQLVIPTMKNQLLVNLFRLKQLKVNLQRCEELKFQQI